MDMVFDEENGTIVPVDKGKVSDSLGLSVLQARADFL